LGIFGLDIVGMCATILGQRLALLTTEEDYYLVSLFWVLGLDRVISQGNRDNVWLSLCPPDQKGNFRLSHPALAQEAGAALREPRMVAENT
jgi:hypothetical protein